MVKTEQDFDLDKIIETITKGATLSGLDVEWFKKDGCQFVKATLKSRGWASYVAFGTMSKTLQKYFGADVQLVTGPASVSERTWLVYDLVKKLKQ